MSEENKELLREAFKRAHTDDDGFGIEVSGKTMFDAFVKNLELQTEQTFSVYSKETGEEYEIPLTTIYELEEGVLIIQLNIGLWAKPYFSVDMIVTRNGKPRELLVLAKKLREHYLGLPIKLPILIDTVNPTIMRRIFDPKIDESFKDLNFIKLRETYLLYQKPEKGQESVVDYDRIDLFELETAKFKEN